MESGLKISEAALKYGISRRTLENELKTNQAIKHSRVGKKIRIFETEENDLILKELAVRYKRNSIVQVQWTETSVDPRFYTIFDDDEQILIHSALKRKSLMDLKWWYYDKGAKLWDEFYFASPVTKVVNHLLDQASSFVMNHIGESRVNIIDIGCGNGQPAIKFIKRNKLRNKINKYVAVDISNELVATTKQRLTSEFPDIQVEQYIHDIERESFEEALLRQQYLDPSSINIILYLGHTINNQEDRLRVLKNIRTTMTERDLLLISASTNDSKNILPDQYSLADNPKEAEWILDAIGIDLVNCQQIQEYDPERGLKVNYVILDKNYKISFDILNTPSTLELLKGQKINVWSHYLIDKREFEEQLEYADLRVMNYIEEPDGRSMMFICRGL